MRHSAVATCLMLSVLGAPAHAQVLRLTDMNTDQIRALDRARTAVVIAGAPLEEHALGCHEVEETRERGCRRFTGPT